MMGGSLFMSILTILFAAILAMAIWYGISIATGRARKSSNFRHQLTYLKALGLFTMITGILGQLIGLFDAFSAIERAMDISPMIMFGGLKISMITTLTGIGFNLVSILLWFLLDLWHNKSVGAHEAGA